MEQWIQWGVNIVVVITMGTIGVFLRRTLTRMEGRQAAAEKSLLRQVEMLKAETQERSNRSERDIENLQHRVNDIVKELPRMYVQKEDWLLSNQNIERKLDRIMEILMNQGKGGRDNVS